LCKHSPNCTRQLFVEYRDRAMSDNELGAVEAAPEQDSGSDSATEERPQDQAEKVQFDPDQQEKLNEIVGGVRMKARSEAQDLRARNDALEQRLSQFEAQQPAMGGPLHVPDMPDKFDENFESVLAQREQALVETARWEAEQEAKQIIEQQRERDQNVQVAQALHQKGEVFSQRAREIGISEQEQRNAVQKIKDAGVNPMLMEEMLDSPNGPAMLRALDRDVNRLLDVAEKSNQDHKGLIDAMIDLRQFDATAPQNTAPRPPDMLQGTGVPAQKRGPRGLLIE